MSTALELGIVGFPVAHSKSPEMHQAAAADLGVALDYQRFEVSPDNLERVVATKHRQGIDGYNVTVPHKEAILTLLDEVSPEARAIGAVNTVVQTTRGYLGHNTDAPGLVRSLADASVLLDDSRVVIVGAGGAARAAAVGLAEAGASEVTILARRTEQADRLVEAITEHIGCPIESAPLSEAAWYFDSATLLVQATSATLESNPNADAFAASLPIDQLPDEAAVVDLVYKPRKTAVLARAEQRALRTIDGLGMLLHQGAIAFEMWTGKAPSLDVMRRALEG
ncbi:MAG: shikimate dehydrogenase [Myxococcota bacterium]